MVTKAAMRAVRTLRTTDVAYSDGNLARVVDDAMHLPPLFDAIRGVLTAFGEDEDVAYGHAWLAAQIKTLRDAFKATEGDGDDE